MPSSPATPPPTQDQQVSLAIANALVLVMELLSAKGLVSKPELTTALDAEAAKFNDGGRPAAASFTTLIADSFRGDHGQSD